MTYNLDFINHLIQDEIEESLNLEYKAADALGRSEGKKKEISKDISSMANSAGGIVIYGIKEYQEDNKKHKPEGIDAVNRSEFSKEWLDNILSSNIQPKINGLIIHPISVSDDSVVYVIEIPQSNTAHQAKDYRYYKRRNFKSEPMEDYELKDTLNRKIHPEINLEFELVKNVFRDKSDVLNLRHNADSTFVEEYTLQISAVNNGKVYAKYINFFIRIPKKLLKDSSRSRYPEIEENGQIICLIDGDNTKRDVIGYTTSVPFNRPNFGSSWFNPLLPEISIFMNDILMADDLDKSTGEFEWTVYADNATPINKIIKLSDIKYREQIDLNDIEYQYYLKSKQND